MTGGGLPEDIVARFRTLSLERIARVEASWLAFTQGAEDEEAALQMSRDLHNVKGDAQIAGFSEISHLCQKLEDLLEVAATLHYEVPEDFELVVTMAIQFLGLLLRKKDAGTMKGFDLDGFVRQVDEVLHGVKSAPITPRSTGGMRTTGVGKEVATDRISDATRHRLAAAATSAYLEYLRAYRSGARARLRALWNALRDEVIRSQSVMLLPLLQRHQLGGMELARELGKAVLIDVDAAEHRTDARVAEAIDLALVHLVRNSIDHGIEPPDVRRALGKPEEGSIRIAAREADGSIEVAIEDDGAGVDFEAVRRRAVERALIDERAAAAASSERLLELLFRPGFSTRTEVNEVSGRGVGMDAARSALVRVGGSVRVETRQGGGTRFTLSAPVRIRHLAAYRFLAPGGAIALAVTAGWTPETLHPGQVGAGEVIDPLQAIELARSARQSGVTSEPVRDLVIRLRWGFLELHLQAASEPVLVNAERMCPTADDHPVEIVLVDGQEALLVRPEHLAPPVGRRRRRAS